MNTLIYLIVNGLAVLITAYLIPGVHVDSFFVAIVVSVVIGIINLILKPILLILTLPINILTLGLFTLIINGLLILLTSRFVPGFYVDGLLQAILFSIILSFISSFFNWIIKN